MDVVRLPRLSRAVKTALVMALSVAYVGWHAQGAYAKGGGDDSGGDDGDDAGDDDGGGKGDKGGDDDDDGNGDGSDQPSVYAGGLYTINTYPIRENDRPLTMTKGVTQVRLGVGTDLSAKGAFASFGANLEAMYGYSDNFTIIGGLTDAYNFKQFGVYFGFEGALAYDLLDIRLAANVHRNAVALYSDFCNPPSVPGEVATGTPGMGNETCQSMNSAIQNLPNGNFLAGGTKFSIDLGFPFRYSIKPEIAIIALQTLISFDFNAVDVDHASVTPVTSPAPGQPATIFQKTGNSAKPDFNPSIGIVTNPIPQLSVTIYAQLRIPDFDTSAGQFVVPVTARVEASPSQKLDFGLEFTLLNVKPPDGQSPIDNRYLSLFAQARY